MLVCKRYCSYDLTVGNAEVSFLYEGRETTETLKCKSSRSIGEYEYIIGVIWVVANSSNVRLVTGSTTFQVRVLGYPLSQLGKVIRFHGRTREQIVLKTMSMRVQHSGQCVCLPSRRSWVRIPLPALQYGLVMTYCCEIDIHRC